MRWRRSAVARQPANPGLIVTDTSMRCGPKVTPLFNGTPAELNEASKDERQNGE
jgi:hypothetical protein